jgi:hypothetical protein
VGPAFFAGEPVSRPAFSRAKTSRQDCRLADVDVGPTWFGTYTNDGLAAVDLSM